MKACHRFGKLIIFVSLLLMAPLLQAQESCELDKAAAIAESGLWCEEIAAGMACYGNPSLQAAGDAAESFRLPGDQIALADLDSLMTAYSPLAWPLALFDLALYPANSWQAQTVRMLVFGELDLEDESSENRGIIVETLFITAAQGANLRSGPTTEYRILQPLFTGDPVKATGRLADLSWLRVQLPDGRTAWLNASAVAQVPESLPIVTLDSDAPGRIIPPYQHFSFATRTNADCVSWPQSGLMLQTPLGETLPLEVNGLAFTLTGTAFLQTDETADGVSLMRLAVLEGETLLQGEDLPARIEAGYELRYPLTESEDPPRRAAYDYRQMISLPVVLLPRYVYAALDLRTIIRPSSGVNPIATLLVNDECTITTGPGGSNLRGGPGLEYPIRAVLDYWESARPNGRALGTDNSTWWQLTTNLWVRADTTVTGGDCARVPQVAVPQAPPR